MEGSLENLFPVVIGIVLACGFVWPYGLRKWAGDGHLCVVTLFRVHIELMVVLAPFVNIFAVFSPWILMAEDGPWL